MFSKGINFKMRIKCKIHDVELRMIGFEGPYDGPFVYDIKTSICPVDKECEYVVELDKVNEL